MKDGRRVLDVAALPETTFGSRNLMWWGALGYTIIEGTMIVMCAMAYLYVRKNFASWPPIGTPNPDLLIPTINLVLLLSTVPVQMYVDRKSRNFERIAVRNGLVVLVTLGVVTLVLRWFELKALNTRWDTDAYGSTAWFTVGSHTLVYFLEIVETAIGLVIFLTRREEPKHFSDAVDSALYWYFVIGIWVLVYLLIYWGPRVL